MITLSFDYFLIIYLFIIIFEEVKNHSYLMYAFTRI